MEYKYFIQQLRAVRKTNIIERLKTLLTNIIDCYGFKEFAYVRFSIEGLNPEEIINTFSDAWTKQYLKRDYKYIDPVFDAALEKSEPFYWSADNYRSDVIQRSFFEDASSHGVHHGITIPLKSTNKLRAVLSYTADEQNKNLVPIAQNQRKLIELRTFAEVFHQKVIELKPGYEYVLKQRECQVLELSSFSLKSEEIALLLNLTRDYVNEITANALSRLGTRNRPSAVF